MKTFRDILIKALDRTPVCPDGNGNIACPSCLAEVIEPQFRALITQEISQVCVDNHKADNADGEPIVCGDCLETISAIDTTYEHGIAVSPV